MRYLVSFITFFLILILLSIFSILIIEMYIGHELSDRDLESVRMKLLSLIELSFSFLLTRFLVKNRCRRITLLRPTSYIRKK
ncbi:hypothetical protein CH371_14930 [Leptospira wolffii]|uniref:Uncharacterized protein n=1 Tax=Leptospira wolffii TaxID=409998 RepID=A0A2M9Z9U7_9LEPT|nr:hypothetical protein CH371_14930 [Leptospira wolffii]